VTCRGVLVGMTRTLAAEATAGTAVVGLLAPHRRRSLPGGDPVVRVHLDTGDLARTQVHPGGPFMEAVLGLRLLLARQPNPLGAAWVRQVRPVLQATNLPLAVLSLVERLVDLHTIAVRAPSVIDALRQLEAGRIEPLPRTDRTLVWIDRAPASVRSWLRGLWEGDPRAVDAVVRMFVAYYQRAVDPHWRVIRSYLEAERSRCGNVITHGGLDRLLSTLHPKVRWRPPVLEVSGEIEGPRAERVGSAPVLEGRSLVLVPSAFGLDGPRILASHRDPTLPVVLVYPALRRMDDAAALWTPGHAPNASALAKLLGQTQAAVLAAIADTRTTTELAARVGISLPTASHHTSILRGAGLVVSRRQGNTVVHRLTPLGAELLGVAA
jgi:DNA-binding transcriptional ArsR family regulator